MPGYVKKTLLGGKSITYVHSHIHTCVCSGEYGHNVAHTKALERRSRAEQCPCDGPFACRVVDYWLYLTELLLPCDGATATCVLLHICRRLSRHPGPHNMRHFDICRTLSHFVAAIAFNSCTCTGSYLPRFIPPICPCSMLQSCPRMPITSANPLHFFAFSLLPGTGRHEILRAQLSHTARVGRVLITQHIRS